MEWRMVVTAEMYKQIKREYPDTTNFNKLCGVEVSAIYLGAKFRNNYIQEETKLLAQQLLRTCKEKNIPIFYMRMENQKFCLFSEKITPNYFDH